MQQEDQNKMITKALKGNQAAMELFSSLAWCSQLIDDYWDGDKPVTKEQMLSVILVLAVDIPRNPFYQMLQDDVIRIIEDALCFWAQASDLELSAVEYNEADAHRILQISYINRSVITDVLIKLARLVGGRAHERAIACEVRRAVYLDNEYFADYFKEHWRAKSCA